MAKKEEVAMPASKPNWRCRCRLSVKRIGGACREYHVFDVVAKDATEAKLLSGRIAKDLLPLADDISENTYEPETM